MRKETIHTLVEEYKGDCLAEYIYEQLELEKKIKKDIQKLLRCRKDIHAKFNSEMDDLNRSIADVQQGCPHHEVTFFSDPAGGSSSYYECDWCGATV